MCYQPVQCQLCWQAKSTTQQKRRGNSSSVSVHHRNEHIKQKVLLLLNMLGHILWTVSIAAAAHYSTQTTLPWWIKPPGSCLGLGSRFTSLLPYGSNRPQGLLGLEGLTSDGTLLLCVRVESEPEPDGALPPTGGYRIDGVLGRSSPSASPSSSRGSRLWWWWCWWSCWWCPPWRWGSCIMFSTSESSEWLDC